MKVIFLDFDGVILTLRTTVSCGGGWSCAVPDEVLVRVLQRCCQSGGVRIVVSSTWRTHEKTCFEKLIECNLLQFLHEDWRTIEEHYGEAVDGRPHEISEWLSRHPEVTDYRILDDDSWRWVGPQIERSLKCDPEDGASARVLIALREFAGLAKRDVAIMTADE